MAKLRHLAFVCKDPQKMADYLHDAFDLEILYRTDTPDVTALVLSDGVINFTLLSENFANHDPVPWHFGLELTQEEIEARRDRLAQLGTPIHDGVRDGRPVEAYLHTPEGHRIDLAPFWPTQKGQSRRQEEYKAWEQEQAPAKAGS